MLRLLEEKEHPWRLRLARYIGFRLQYDPYEAPPKWLARIAGHRWEPVSGTLVDHAVTCLGIPESDVRDMREAGTGGAVIVRLWNHRTFEVGGDHLAAHHT